MLYLHCGWPRTSTSSLQAALSDHSHRLAAAGISYPDEWMSDLYPTHHGLTELLQESLTSGRGAFAELERFLASGRDRDVLFSAEALSYWLAPRARQDALMRLLETARGATRIRCIWTLRRMDDLVASLYLLQLAEGADLPPPAQYFDSAPELDTLFAGMVRAEQGVGGDVAYLAYAADGRHHRGLLEAAGIPPRLVTEIHTAIAGAPRLNRALSRKQAIALRHLDALAERAGVEFDRAAIRKAFYRDELSFAEDLPCELVGDGVRRELHERALAAAERQGFAPYVALFGEVDIAPCAPVALGPGAITDADLASLLAVAHEVRRD